jgi:hypothetical protein
MVVKNIISRLGSLAFILLATASIRVKWPNPTPFVGNITTQFPLEDTRPARLAKNAEGWAFQPSNSNPIIAIIQGRVMIRKGALQGFRIASVI